MKMLFLTAIACIWTTSAFADRINSGGYVGCITKDALDEFITAAVNYDERHMRSLIGTVCAAIGGMEYSMVDRGFVTSKVRVYVGDSSVVLYTVAEAAR
ncbi:MAG: hypothetical protein ACK4VZ_07445 [Paracoccaceae bacterium]